MKTCVFCFLLCAVLLFAFPVCADTDETQFLGLWVDCDYSDDVDFAYIDCIAIRPNHKVFLVIDKFYDFSDEGLPDNRVYEWRSDGNHLMIMNPQNGSIFRDLYYFDNGIKYLSFFEDGRSERYCLVHGTGHEDPAPQLTAAPPVVSDVSLPGKWSCYWDVRDLNAALGSSRMNFDIRSYDLFFLEDGTVYLESVTCQNGVFSSAGALLPGTWQNDGNLISINLGTKAMNAWLDDYGRLFVQMTDEMAMIYEKVSNYNYEEGMF